MLEMLCKLINSLIDLVRYTVAGIIVIVMLPLSLIVYTIIGIVHGLDSGYRNCYNLMYNMIKLIFRKNVKIVTLKEGQEYDEHLGAYYPEKCVCTVCNCEVCECEKSEKNCGEKDE